MGKSQLLYYGMDKETEKVKGEKKEYCNGRIRE
jgi:hypothetical protein